MLRACIAGGAGARAWALVGMAEHARGRLSEAGEAFGRAIEADPGNADGWCARATIRAASGDLEGAGRDLAEALALVPTHVQALCNLAILREQQGDRMAALALYDRALVVDGASQPARRNRGALRLDSGDPAGALEDFDHLVALPLCGADAHVSRARALFALFRDAEALDAAQAALRIEPANRRAVLDRGFALASLGRLDEAAKVLEHAGGTLGLTPRAMRIGRLLQRQAVCDWSVRDAALAEVRSALDDAHAAAALAEPGLVLSSLGLPLTPLDLRRLGEAAFRPAQREGARLAASAPPLVSAPGRARLRVGFFAANLRVHPESFLVRRIFTDRDTAGFEYLLYALSADDGSALRGEIARSADRFVDVSGWDDASILRAARADRLDLAVDLSSGYAHGKPEIFAARVAPVQAAYLAAPSTLGAGLHDYRLSDPWSTPPATQACWSERLALVSPTLFAYDNQLLAGERGTRESHRLPPGPVFTCMNQAFKIEPDCFAVWMRLLGRVPSATLWLLDPGGVARANLIREAQARGVLPDRLVFAPNVPLREHLGRLAHADLFLDTFHCNAHATALDALWAGVPVLTLAGATMASRLASSFVRSAGLAELAAASVADYESTAVRLATDAQALAAMKARVQAARRASPLFDTPSRVRAVERAFAAMVEASRAGRDAGPLEIS